MENRINEEFVRNKIIEFMIKKEDGNWHEEKVEINDLHMHGVDIKLTGGKKNSEYFFIECKGILYLELMVEYQQLIVHINMD